MIPRILDHLNQARARFTWRELCYGLLPCATVFRWRARAQTGQFLVDNSGYTLYYFLKDTPGAGTSACTGACPGLWPPFSPGSIKVSSPLQASDFSMITLPGGTMQATYRGWPLYRFANDAAPGVENGNDYKGVWYVMGLTGVVTTATTTVPTTVPTTSRPTTVPTTYRSSSGGGY